MPGCSTLVLACALLAVGQADSAPPPSDRLVPTPIAASLGLPLLPLAPAAPVLWQPAPIVAAAPPDENPPEPIYRRRALNIAEVWGFAQEQLLTGGTRMAPNGLAYHPLFDSSVNLNIGLLPNKLLYLFGQVDFWGQRATSGQTHGNFDFTKREFDFNVGVAWNYYGALEARVFGYANNNLNRGLSLAIPFGYADGIGVENRLYLPSDDIYDISRLGFVSVGYMPSKTLVGADGNGFNPGAFARAYLTYDLGIWQSYAYLDGQISCNRAFMPRLLTLDAGLAARPFPKIGGLEFRLGGTDTYDVQTSPNRGLGYLAIRFLW